MRLPGTMAFASPWTSPSAFGAPGLLAKSSISSFSRKPAPRTVTAEPNQKLIVVVMATALPLLSATEKCVVCLPSRSMPISAETSVEGVARSVEMEPLSLLT
jgi:hypothetical protein